MTFFSEKPRAMKKSAVCCSVRLQVQPGQSGQFGGGQAPVEAAAAPVAKRPMPGISDDTRFFWEGTRRLAAHSALQGLWRVAPSTLPVCPSCHSFEWDTVEAV